jgi:hypothetical protein
LHLFNHSIGLFYNIFTSLFLCMINLNVLSVLIFPH